VKIKIDGEEYTLTSGLVVANGVSVEGCYESSDAFYRALDRATAEATKEEGES
jgi:hypothetical protein